MEQCRRMFSQGLTNFEQLELLSNRSSTIVQTMTYGNEALLEQISTYFHLNNDDDDDDDDDELTLNSLTINEQYRDDIPTLDSLSQKFTAYQMQVRSTVSVDKLLELYESAHQFINECDRTDTHINQKVAMIAHC
jgi:hypothetical protein